MEYVAELAMAGIVSLAFVGMTSAVYVDEIRCYHKKRHEIESAPQLTLDFVPKELPKKPTYVGVWKDFIKGIPDVL